MNPFSYGTVVKEPYFFDRREELQRIVATLKGGNNLVLYAPRRYGKTSLVMKAIEELENAGYRCVYFDFMTIYSRESFVEMFVKAILNKQSNWKKALQSFAEFVKGVKPAFSINDQGNPEFSIEFTEPGVSDNTLDTVIDLPEKLAAGGKPTIIVMDEFSHQRLPLEQDIQKLNGENFENLLRSKIQHHQHVNYLFLGSRTHLLYDMFTNQNRPFYNSAATMSIGTLPRDETINFLTERFSQSGITLNNATAARLIEKAGEIPYYIQFLAAEVWQYTVNATKIVTEDIVDCCADKIIDLKNDFYFELFDRQTAYQKKLLKALAEDGHNIFSGEYAAKFRLSAASTTQKAVAGLINSGIIEKMDNNYSFNDPFFKYFVLRLSALRPAA